MADCMAWRRRTALAAGVTFTGPALAQNRPPPQQPVRAQQGSPAAPAQAESNQVVIGRDGWLFGAWENVRQVDLRKTREV